MQYKILLNELRDCEVLAVDPFKSYVEKVCSNHYVNKEHRVAYFELPECVEEIFFDKLNTWALSGFVVERLGYDTLYFPKDEKRLGGTFG